MADAQMKLKIDVKDWETLPEYTKSFVNFVMKDATLHFYKWWDIELEPGEDPVAEEPADPVESLGGCIHTPRVYGYNDAEMMNIQLANSDDTPNQPNYRMYLPGVAIENFAAKESTLELYSRFNDDGVVYYVHDYEPICDITITPVIGDTPVEESQVIEIDETSFDEDNLAEFPLLNNEKKPVNFSLRTSTFRIACDGNTNYDVYYKIGVHPLPRVNESVSQTVSEFIENLKYANCYVSYDSYKSGAEISIETASGYKENNLGEEDDQERQFIHHMPKRMIMHDEEMQYLIYIEMHDSATGNLTVVDFSSVEVLHVASSNNNETWTADNYIQLSITDQNMDGGFVPADIQEEETEK